MTARTKKTPAASLASKNANIINAAAHTGARIAAAKGEIRSLKDAQNTARVNLAALGVVLSVERVGIMMKAFSVTVAGALGVSVRVTANMTPAETGLHRDLMVALARECAPRTSNASTPIGELTGANWAAWGKDAERKALKESVRRALRALTPQTEGQSKEFNPDAAVKLLAAKLAKAGSVTTARQVAVYVDMLKAEMLEAIKAAKAEPALV